MFRKYTFNCHSRESGNPKFKIPAFAGMTIPRTWMKILCLLFYFGFITTVFAASHDPTCPPDQNPYLNGKGLGDLKVQAIFISPTKKRVIIGGKDLTVGDKVMGAKIVYIGEHSVTLQGGQGKFIIEIFRPIKKKPVNKKGETL